MDSMLFLMPLAEDLSLILLSQTLDPILITLAMEFSKENP